MLDPLRRDRSLAALVDQQLVAVTDTIAGLWQVYEWQEAFASQPEIADIAHKFDFPLVRHLFLMEHRGIKLDSDFLQRMSIERLKS